MDANKKIASSSLLAVFAKQAKDNPEANIPVLLKSNFALFGNDLQFKNLFFSLLLGTENFKPHLINLKKQAESLQRICAKSLSSNDVAWKCETCEMDPTCIICVECFEKSNHEGHLVRLQRGAAGCCDCGDTTAWKASGF